MPRWPWAYGLITPEGGRIRTRAGNPSTVTLPVVRTLALEAGVLLFVAAASAVAVIVIAFIANAQSAASLLHPAPLLRLVAVLGAVQIACFALMWHAFRVSRRRFAVRLQAVTGGMDDDIFLADIEGNPVARLDGVGWTPTAATEWFESIHPDDRALWPLKDQGEARRVELRLRSDDGDWRWHRLRATPLHDDRGNLREWIGTLHDIHDQKLAGEHRDLIIGELRHRLKNLVTVIDALAKNSRRRPAEEPGVEAFLQRFLGRLHALGAAGDLVLAGNRVSIDAGALARATLAPFMNESAQRIRIDGPPLLLSEELGAGLGLTVHELATNALKYGALSVPDGSVSFRWTITPGENGRDIVFVWEERGGPRPVAPEKPGFGTRMIKYAVARERDGRAEIDYRPEGVVCRIAFTAEPVDAPARPPV